MAAKLTPIAVENAKPKRVAGNAVRTEIPDRGCPGLYLVVQSSRPKSWALRYRFKGKSKKLTLGTVADKATPAGLTLAAARAGAAQALHQVSLGNDPAAAKQAARAASAEQAALRAQDSVAKLVGQFVQLHAARKTRPLSLAQTESVMRRFVIPAWGDRSIHDIKRRDVIALVEPIAVEHPYMANRALGVLSKFFNWCLARDLINASPCAGVERPGVEVARDRVLDDGEIAQLWAACGDDDPFGAAIRVMLLTGSRRSEVANMTWAEINEQERLWVLPAARSKNKRAHQVPFSPLAWKIIRSVPRIAGCDYVFSTTGKGPLANFHHIKDRLDSKLNFAEPWVIHDTRRSCASGLQRLGVRVEVIEATPPKRSVSLCRRRCWHAPTR